MKKLLYLFLALSFACSSDDDESNTSIDGNWQLTSIKENGQSIHDSCDLESYMVIDVDNSGTYFQYYLDDPATEPCGLDATYNFSVSAGSSSSNYNWILEGVSSPLVLNGNTLQLTFGSDEVLEFVKN
tara:strand:+ start:5864 stop:6247 length:384 start_codon:yes stop_codon:yes gene_type:complete